MLIPPAVAASESKHILLTADGIQVVWVWSGETWRMPDGVKDNTPADMTNDGWTYGRAL